MHSREQRAVEQESLRVLLVEDEQSLLQPLAKRLRTVHGYYVDTADTAAEAWRLVETASHPYDVVLIDDLLAPESGVEPAPIGIALMEQIRARVSQTECIVFTGWGMERALKALRAGAYRYLTKPLNLDELAMTIRLAAEQARLRQERDLLSATLAISNAMVRGLDIEKVLQVIADVVPPLVDADSCAVARVEPRTDQVWYDPVIPLGDPSVRWNRHLRDVDLTRKVIEDGECFIMSDVNDGSQKPDDKLHQAGVKSLIAVPIPGDPRNLGVLYAYSTRKDAFDGRERQILQLLAGQAAVALENVQLYEDARCRAREMELLYDLGIDLNASLELRQVLERIARSCLQLTQAETSTAIIYHERSGKYVRIGVPVRPEGPVLEDEPRPEGYTRLVMDSGEPVRIADLARDERAGPLKQGIRSLAGVPIRLTGKVIGVLFIYSTKLNGFGRREVTLLSFLANQAAIAVANAQYVEEIQAGLKQLRSLYGASSAIISTMDPKQVLEVVAEEARQALGGWRAKIALISEQGKPTDLAVAGFDEGLDTGFLIRPDGISAQVRASGELWHSEDVQKAPEEVNPVMVEDGVRAAACVPFGLRHRNVGVMWVHYRHPRRFLPTEIEALKLYANHAAIAYDNALRMQELEQMRKAARVMSRALEPRSALQQIVESAAQVLQADSSVIWSFDEVRGEFIPDELVAVGIPSAELQRFRQDEITLGRTADTVMDRGYVAVTDTSAPSDGFLGEPTRELFRRMGIQSFQGIALRAGEERLGVLYTNYTSVRSLDEDDEAKLRTFASHAALALKSARLLAQMQRTREAARVIADVTAQEDLGQTLKAIARNTRQVLCADAVTLYSYNGERERFGEWATDIVAPHVADAARAPENLTSTSVAWSVLDLAEPPYYILAEDRVSQDQLLGGYFVEVEGIRAAIGIQLRVGSRKLGVMFVNFRSPHRFTSDEIATIQLFADQAAVAIRNAQLYCQSQERASALELLYEAGQVVSGSLSLPEVLSHIVEQIWHLIEPSGEKRAQFSSLALKEGEILKFVATYPPEQNELLQEQVGAIDLRESRTGRLGITGRAVNTGRPQRVSNVAEDPDYIELEPCVRSELVVPLIAGSQVIGAINVEHPDLGAFDAEDQQVLEALAAQAALAIRNAQIYAELKQRYRDLRKIKGFVGSQTVLDWMRMVSGVWGHGIKREVGTSLASVELAREAIAAGECDRALQELAELKERVEAIRDIPISAPLSVEDAVTSVRVNRVIRTYLQNLWKHPQYAEVHLELNLQSDMDEIAMVRASEGWLRQAIKILVDNAVEAMLDADSPNKELVATTCLVDGKIDVLIRDTGPGVPEKTRELLFQKPIDKPRGSRGAGVGLVLAKTIVEAYHGQIRLHATGPTGTTMMISLPVEEKRKPKRNPAEHEQKE